MKPGTHPISVLCLSLCLSACMLSGCTTSPRESVVIPQPLTDMPLSQSPNSLDEATVFAQDQVKRLDITIQPADWQVMQANLKSLFSSATDVQSGADPIYRPCSLRFEGQTWRQVGIRYKGESSLQNAWDKSRKLPFRLDFEEFASEHPELKGQRFFGFKTLTLSSGFSDDSLIREKVVADMFRAAGVPAARTAFYRLYVDYGQGSQYFGLYTLVEVPDTPLLMQHFQNTDGNLYKPEGGGAAFVSFDKSSFAKKSNQKKADWSDIQALFSALHAPRDDKKSWRSGLEKVFDVDGFLNFLALNTLMQNWDSYGRTSRNYYLYASQGRLHWIPWDHNLALMDPGNPENLMNSPGAQNPGSLRNALSLDLSATQIGSDWPLIRYLIDDPVYSARYVAAVKTALTSTFALEATRQRYRTAHALIRPYVIGPQGEQPDATLLSSPAAFEASLKQLETHLENRHRAAQMFLAREQATASVGP